MLQYKNELVQLKLHFDQAQSDIPLWVKSCGVGRGRSPSLALSRLADGSSFSHGVTAESSNSLWDWKRFLISSPSMGLEKEEWQASLEYEVRVSSPSRGLTSRSSDIQNRTSKKIRML
ncbi:hypothetical protein Nmel_007428 [Mimus melanotis]